MTFQRDAVKLLTSVDGEPVALHDFGGSGPVLLLGHGNGLNAGMWAAALPVLLEHFRCFGVDLRGHGAAWAVSDEFSVAHQRLAQDLLVCIDAVGEPVCYAAHSLSGATALHATLDRPEAFHGLWLYEPVLLPIGFDRNQHGKPTMLIEAARRRRMEFASVDEAVSRFTSKLPFLGCDRLAVQGYVEVGSYPVEGGIRLSCRRQTEVRIYETLIDLDFARLGAVEIATVVACGGSGEDHSVPAILAPLVVEALPEARLEKHRWMSHFGPMEGPETIAQSIMAHLLPLSR